MRRVHLALAVLALLLCYAQTLRGMITQWWNDEDMGHGFAVPVVIAWLLWRERARWLHLPLQPSRWGFLVLAAGAALQIAGALGAGLFAASLGFLISIAGVVLCLAGFVWLRTWTFPFVLALFMLPKLAIVYNQMTLPLELLATRLAGAMLSLAGFAVTRQGNILGVAGHQISVVEACNGIRYLLPLCFLTLVFGYVADSPLWTRITLVALAVPLAIGANALRVAVSGLSPALISGIFHPALGVLAFIVCFIVLLTAHSFFRLLGSRPE